MPTLPTYLTSRALARGARVSRGTVMNMLADGRILPDGMLGMGRLISPIFVPEKVAAVVAATLPAGTRLAGGRGGGRLRNVPARGRITL